jgi:hypothetical protein
VTGDEELLFENADEWVCHVDLAPGEYTYEFLVDGMGLLDSTTPATESGSSGLVDSVIVIKAK